MNFKKIATLFLSILLLSLCGCNNTAPNDLTSDSSAIKPQVNKRASDTIRLLYSSKDSLDPYTCVTEQNADLAQLIFEPLLIINNQYEIEYRLAEEVALTDDLCTIVLKTAKFSDGTVITADDVVFSFNKARLFDFAAILHFIPLPCSLRPQVRRQSL